VRVTSNVVILDLLRRYVLSEDEGIERFHPYSSATRAALTEPDELRRQFGRDELPVVEPFRLHWTPDGLALTFSSSIRYRQPTAGQLLDVMKWRVTSRITSPPGGPHGW
jgi:hypothetical protein